MAGNRGTVYWTTVAGLLGLIAAVLLWAVWGSGQDDRARPLPALGADLARTSVSGLSSGAYMAGQFHIAHSDIVIGAGLVAGGPYGCAESEFSRLWPIWTAALPHNLNLALNACMDDSLAIMDKPDITKLAERTRELAEEGKIAPVDRVAADRVYLFHASGDETVARSVVGKTADYYREMGVADGQIRFVRFDRGAHAFITLETGADCGVSGPPYLNDCDYDQAGEIIRHLHDGAAKPEGPPKGAFAVYDQTRYLAGSDQHSMAGEGVVYIPPGCRNRTGCAVHIAFHGCKQNRAQIGDAFVRGSGHARWADANRLLVLFPQIKRSAVNPRACWDWWGYTGLNYRERSAPQIAAVRAMLDGLTQQP